MGSPFSTAGSISSLGGLGATTGTRARVPTPLTGAGRIQPCTRAMPHTSSLQAPLSCLPTKPPVWGGGCTFFPISCWEKNDVMAQPPAEQGNERYSRNPGNAYRELSSNEDRVLWVQLCTAVVLTQPERNCWSHTVPQRKYYYCFVTYPRPIFH